MAGARTPVAMATDDIRRLIRAAGRIPGRARHALQRRHAAAKRAWGRGSTPSPAMPQPAAELVEQVYQELRRLADGYVRRERAKSVQATELVHEAYLRLLKDPSPRWQDRGHFLAIAAISMRRLLVERARARAASKRGGDQVAVTLDEAILPEAATGDPVDLIALDRALEALARRAPGAGTGRRAQVLRRACRWTKPPTALDRSPATVKRHWTFAKAWLLSRDARQAGVIEVSELFHRALELAPADRAAFLDVACAGDASLQGRGRVAARVARDRRHVHGNASSRGRSIDRAGGSVRARRWSGSRSDSTRFGACSVPGAWASCTSPTTRALGRTVALKAIAPQFAADDGRRERLRREARAAATLSHPNIATVYALEQSAINCSSRPNMSRARRCGRKSIAGGSPWPWSPRPPWRWRARWRWHTTAGSCIAI